MNAVGELGELIIQYQSIIEIALLSIFGIMILFFVIRAFVRAQKRKNVLNDISSAVENINETVSEIKEKQESLKADIHYENRRPQEPSGQAARVVPADCEINKRIMQECDKIDSYMADLAARMNIKEEHIEKLQQIQLDQFANKDLDELKDESDKIREDVNPCSLHDEEVKAAESSLVNFEAESIDDELWKEDVVERQAESAEPAFNLERFQDEEPVHKAFDELLETSKPEVNHVAEQEEAQITTLEPKVYGEPKADIFGEDISDEDMPLQTVEEILAQCNNSDSKSKFKENWDDESSPSYTFERPEVTVKQGEYARQAAIIMEEERAKEEAARKAELARQQEEARKAELARQQEAARRAELARQQEAARKAELARKQEAARKAELAKQQEAARRTELAKQQEVARKAELARQQEAARRSSSTNSATNFSKEDQAIIQQGANRFEFNLEPPTMEKGQMGSDRKQAAANFLDSFGNTLKEEYVPMTNTENVAPETNRQDTTEFVGNTENPFVEAFNKMAAQKEKSNETMIKQEEESVASVDNGIPPKKYFSTDCATDKFGKSYTEEELKNQIN